MYVEVFEFVMVLYFAAIAAFNLDYTRWVEQQNRHLSKLRSALETHASSVDLRTLVENGTSLYDELFQLKSRAVKADVFHVVSGMWKTPAERCLMWMGGFRPSDLLKVHASMSCSV
jgi:transcription factor TGA